MIIQHVFIKSVIIERWVYILDDYKVGDNPVGDFRDGETGKGKWAGDYK